MVYFRQKNDRKNWHCIDNYSNHQNTEHLNTRFIWIPDSSEYQTVWVTGVQMVVTRLGGTLDYQTFWTINRLFPDHHNFALLLRRCSRRAIAAAAPVAAPVRISPQWERFYTMPIRQPDTNLPFEYRLVRYSDGYCTYYKFFNLRVNYVH